MKPNVELGWTDLEHCTEEGYYTNGHWLLLADDDIKIPKKLGYAHATIRVSPMLCDEQLRKANGTPTRVLYFATESPDGDIQGVSPERIVVFDKKWTKVVFEIGDGYLVVNQCYYNVIVNRYKKATWRAFEDGNGVVAFDDNGPVGAVCGIRWNPKTELLPCEQLALEEGLIPPGRSVEVDFTTDCPKCGQAWCVHNDDGSCVED